MRNIFDQYSQPENRISHALAACLSEDRRLLRKFVRWATGKNPPKNSKLRIIEQGLPGDMVATEKGEEPRGLPDIWIHDDDKWSLVIESKIAAPVRLEQLRRHYSTAIRRGYDDVMVLVLGPVKNKRKYPDWILYRQWEDVYKWLISHKKESEWAARASEYFEVAESRFIEDGYLKEGKMTVFSGVPFGDQDPYNYQEAKRILKLAMDELRKRNELVRELGMDPSGQGRGAITGKGEMSVWDFLRLKGSKEEVRFTKFPHLTLALQHDRIVVIITVPNDIKSSLRRNLIDLGYEGFYLLMEQINKNLSVALKKEKGAVPYVEVVQRHFPSQRSPGIIDANLRYDLRTAFPFKKKNNKVKTQPEWLRTTYDVLQHKKSNLQVAVGAVFPYKYCKTTKTPEILDNIANTWIAGKPLLNVLFGVNPVIARNIVTKQSRDECS